jgi:hypothetical protein
MMRFFIHHDSNGNIISASKTEIMDASLEHPFGGLTNEDSVLEVKPTTGLQTLYCHEICERYEVDVRKKKLRKKASSSRAK